jgi:hypothetical protein
VLVSPNSSDVRRTTPELLPDVLVAGEDMLSPAIVTKMPVLAAASPEEPAVLSAAAKDVLAAMNAAKARNATETRKTCGNSVRSPTC